MNALLNPYARIVLNPWQQMRNRWTSETPWVIALALLLAVGSQFAWWPFVPAENRVALQVLVGSLILGAFVVLIWILQLGNLVQQNHPQLAVLVPGHVQRLRHVALALLWLPLLPVAALSYALNWSLPGSLLIFASVIVGFACTLRWLWLWAVIWVLPGTAALWSGLPLVRQLVEAYHARPALLAALGLALLSWAMTRIIGDGGPGHQRSHQWRDRQTKRLAEGTGYQSMPGLNGSYWLFKPFTWITDATYRWAFNNALRRARPTAASALQRADLVTLGFGHWALCLGIALTILQWGAIALGILSLFFASPLSTSGNEPFMPPVWGLGIALLGQICAPLSTTPPALHKSRREQSLLLLLPAMPRERTLNRLLAQRSLRQYALSVLVGFVPMACVFWVLGFLPLALGFLIALVAASPMAIQDGSRLSAPTQNRQAGLQILIMGAGAGFGLGLPAAWLWPLLAATSLLSAALLYGRWQRVVEQAPQAWPTGWRAKV